MEFDRLLRFAVENRASDLHVQAGSPPMLRVGGEMRLVDTSPLKIDDILGFIASIRPDGDGANVAESLAAGLDFSHSVDGVGRFRCSAYSHLGVPAMVTRVIATNIPSIADLNLPEVIQDIALSRRGLTLVSGTTGSGKSTTLAAMIDLLNTTHRAKIVTVEDPVEYVHENRKSLISQLEIGRDSPSFERALRQALRQDPDVILVGELRDVETLRIALRAADTGHQVFSTVHSATAAQTIERIIAMFPPGEHALLLSQLANVVEAIVAQRLVLGFQEKRLPAVEILRGGSVTKKLILEGKVAALSDFIANGESGMQSFDQHLLALYEEEKVSGTEAMRQATNPEAMAMAMRGIKGAGAARG